MIFEAQKGEVVHPADGQLISHAREQVISDK